MMGLTLPAARKGSRNLASPAFNGGAPPHNQSGIHQAVPDELVLYQDC